MSSERILMPKSLAFAKRIVFAYRYLSEEKKEYVLSKQMLRSGTSDYISRTEYDSLHSDCEELRKLLSSITKSVRDGTIPNF